MARAQRERTKKHHKQMIRWIGQLDKKEIGVFCLFVSATSVQIAKVLFAFDDCYSIVVVMATHMNPNIDNSSSDFILGGIFDVLLKRVCVSVYPIF